MQTWIASRDQPRPNVRQLDAYERALRELPEEDPPIRWGWWIAVGVLGTGVWVYLGWLMWEW